MTHVPTLRETEDCPTIVSLESQNLHTLYGTCPLRSGNAGAEHCNMRWLKYRDPRYGNFRLRCISFYSEPPPECPLRSGPVTITGIGNQP